MYIFINVMDIVHLFSSKPKQPNKLNSRKHLILGPTFSTHLSNCEYLVYLGVQETKLE